MLRVCPEVVTSIVLIPPAVVTVLGVETVVLVYESLPPESVKAAFSPKG